MITIDGVGLTRIIKRERIINVATIIIIKMNATKNLNLIVRRVVMINM